MKKYLPYLISTVAIFVIFFVWIDSKRGLPASYELPPSTSNTNSVDELFDSLPVSNTMTSDPLTIPLDNWAEIISEPGLHIYKENISWKNYLLIVDPTQKAITTKNLFDHMDVHWAEAPKPICVVNAGFFEHSGAPTLPVIENSNIIFGKQTGKYPARILYIDSGRVAITDIASNDTIKTSQWAMSGLNPSFYTGDNTVTNRTIIGVKDNQLYIFITQNRTVTKLVDLMTSKFGIASENIIAFDSGMSSQLRCYNEDYLASKSIMGSTLIISNP